MNMTTPQLVENFKEMAIKRHDLLQDNRVDESNRLFDEQNRICAQLKMRGSDERRALLPLLDFPHVSVQCDAAGRCMGFAPDRAIPVLEGLLHSGHWHEIGMASLMLELYRNGKWKPT